LEFLRTKNIQKYENQFNWNYILWMMKDKPFWEKVLKILKDRYIFYAGVWSYAFYHNYNGDVLKEYLMNVKPS